MDKREATGKNLVMKDMMIPVYIGGFLVKEMKTYFSVKNRIQIDRDMITISRGIPEDKTMDMKKMFNSKENLFSISNSVGIRARI